MHPGEAIHTNHSPISSILGAANTRASLNNAGVTPNLTNGDEGQLGLKPDIANMSTFELYEVKPWTNQAGAVAEAAMYVAIFESVGVPMRLGSSGAAGTVGIVQAPAGYCRFWSPVPGVILYQKKQGDYVPTPVPDEQTQEDGAGERSERSIWSWDYWEEATGLTGVALVLYLIISEGSRIIPHRNAIPVP